MNENKTKDIDIFLDKFKKSSHQAGLLLDEIKDLQEDKKETQSSLPQKKSGTEILEAKKTEEIKKVSLIPIVDEIEEEEDNKESEEQTVQSPAISLDTTPVKKKIALRPVSRIEKKKEMPSTGSVKKPLRKSSRKSLKKSSKKPLIFSSAKKRSRSAYPFVFTCSKCNAQYNIEKPDSYKCSCGEVFTV
jgi:hypothetical protein